MKFQFHFLVLVIKRCFFSLLYHTLNLKEQTDAQTDRSNQTDRKQEVLSWLLSPSSSPCRPPAPSPWLSWLLSLEGSSTNRKQDVQQPVASLGASEALLEPVAVGVSTNRKNQILYNNISFHPQVLLEET